MNHLTILRSAANLAMTKKHTRAADGTITTTPYPNALNFRTEQKAFNSINELAAILQELATDRQAVIVRGIPTLTANTDRMTRKMSPATTRDFRLPDLMPHPTGQQWLKLDLDDLPMPHSTGLRLNDDRQIIGIADARQVVADIIRAHLPDYFQDVSVFYGFSSSAGVKPWLEVRLGLWYFLDRAAPDKVLHNWAKRTPGIDPAVFTSNQCNYIAAPVFAGMSDPVGAQRYGLIHGQAITLSIPESQLHPASPSRAAQQATASPVRTPSQRLEHYAAAALASETEKLTTLEEGNRNTELNRAAFSLAGFIPHGLLTAKEITTALLAAAEQNGLASDDGSAVLETITRAISDGQQEPRDLPAKQASNSSNGTPWTAKW